VFEQFLAERRYLKNVTTSTIEWYETAFKAFQRSADCSTPLINKASLQHFVIALRQRGVKPVSCNTYIKAMNAYCRWLHEGGHHQDRLELPTLRVEKLVIQTLGDEQIRRLLTVRPKQFDQWRLHALIALLLDSGIRIDDALTLRLSGLDFDNLLVTVFGKGRKERRIPFSLELRKVLFRYLQIRGKQQVRSDLLFPSRHGTTWDQRNSLRGLHLLQVKLGLPTFGWHKCEHYERAQGFVNPIHLRALSSMRAAVSAFAARSLGRAVR
jgi:integrase/recombinase XerD